MKRLRIMPHVNTLRFHVPFGRAFRNVIHDLRPSSAWHSQNTEIWKSPIQVPSADFFQVRDGLTVVRGKASLSCGLTVPLIRRRLRE